MTSKRKTKPRPPGQYLEVRLLEAKPNPLFTEWERAAVRFLRYSGPVPCAACGRKSCNHWTMLLAFQVADLKNSFGVLKMAPAIYPPLAAVCRAHVMGPVLPPHLQKKKRP